MGHDTCLSDRQISIDLKVRSWFTLHMVRAQRTLMERARAATSRRVANSEDIEMAVAWARGELGVVQVAAAWDVRPTSAYQRLALTFRDALRDGQLQVAA